MSAIRHTYITTYVFNFSEVELACFYEQGKRQMLTPPPPPPLEELIFDALAVINNVDDDPLEVPNTSPSYRPCPIQGCGKSVKRRWNHLHQYHEKRGDAGEDGLIF